MTTLASALLPATIPSPTVGVLHLGPLPLRMYAMCILLGIVLAVWLTGRRLVPRGFEKEQALDVAAWAVLFGIVGGRLYHVVTTPEPYWGENGRPLDALKIWEGGLGIWGAIALGALGAWIGCRRNSIPFLAFADAAAPGVALAQAVGRWGNWFNNELYGGPTDLPWGLTVHEWDNGTGRAVVDGAGDPVVLGTFHPTFLYESLFLVVLAVGLLVLDRRRRLHPGAVFGLYVAGYPVGRIVIEKMRTDEAELVWGQRLNVWTSILVFLLGVWIVWFTRRRAGREGTDDPTAPDDGAPAGARSQQGPESQDVG
ncbi:prolipoprotein diacylglyceryl transferase [Oryzobacter terrae]|uniref:prolipoprotein diacylglyceryl transferase n=1 Tax=Oryzobacter terrae TaxID=1620385 RepID=UPI0036728DCB